MEEEGSAQELRVSVSVLSMSGDLAWGPQLLPRGSLASELARSVAADLAMPAEAVELAHGTERLGADDSLAALGDAEHAELTLVVLPKLEAARAAVRLAAGRLQKLGPKAVNEVKAYARPPDLVLLTLCAVMTLLERTPSWAEAKQALGDASGFLERLARFDAESVGWPALRKLGKYAAHPAFTPDSVASCSELCGELCSWVLAVKAYAELRREASAAGCADCPDVGR